MADDRPGHGEVTETPDRTSLPRAVWVIGALGLVLAIVGAALFVVPQRGGAAGDSAESKQVVSRVKDFAVAYNTYDVADVKEYQARMSGLLTAGYDRDFVKITDALFAAIKDKKQKSGDAVVRDVAVETLDEDSAVVLAVVDATVTNTDNEGEVLRQFRWSINLQKVSGQWRVSRFESVAAQPADAPEPGTADPSATGAPVPTDTATTPSSTPTAGGDPE